MVVVAVSFSRYADGKMLKGTGTRASKSRLTTFQDARVLFSATFRMFRKEDKKNPLASFPRKKSTGRKGRRIRVLLRLLSLMEEEAGDWSGGEVVFESEWRREGERVEEREKREGLGRNRGAAAERWAGGLLALL